MAFKKGQKFTKKHRENLSKARRGKKPWHIGKTKKDFSQLSNAGVKKGNIPWNKGIRNKQVAWNKDLKGYRAGEKHPWMSKGKDHYNWQGGKSFEEYPQDWTETLKESIRQRDSYICQMCGIHQDELDMGQLTKLDIHHIDYNKKNCNPNNLITLCRSCHIKTNYSKDYWIKYFKQNDKS